VGLTELTLRDFRLFHELVVEPDPSAVTVFVSPNGTGKTSVLEAVHVLATGGSFRTPAASDMVRAGAEVAEVHGVLFQGERRVQVDLTVTRGARATTKRMLVNGQRPRSRAEVADVLPLTVFTPEGVEVVRGAPEQRRTFVGNLMTDEDPAASEVVERFARVLTQRNAVLRALAGEAPSAAQRAELELWTDELVAESAELVTLRRGLLARLGPLVVDAYRELAGEEVAVELVYEPSWSGDLAEALARSHLDDRYRGRTGVGPHRDDVRVLLAGRDARRQASQGEQRSLALALRLAGHHLVVRRRGLEPVMLLDDVFSELDPLRADRLLAMLPRGQTLVTTASPLPSALSPSVVVDLTRVAS
jgi:DNA replication and repair protein RecF